MPEFDNTNRFALFRNDKGDNQNRPDYSGSLNVEGREFFISAWVREGAKGKFFSGSIKPKDVTSPYNSAQNDRPKGKMTITSGRQSDPLDDIDDDIRF